MQKGLKIFVKCVVWVFCICAGILAILNIGERFVYHDFYAIYKKEAKNPGLNKKFVPQGCTFDSKEGLFVTAGYMANHSPSRIYTINQKTKQVIFHNLKSEGTDFLGHTGGLQYIEGKFYLANEGVGVYVFDESELANDFVEIGAPVLVNNHSSFVFADTEFLYVGEFHHSGKYDCEHKIEQNGQTHYAIATKYIRKDFEKNPVPVEIYSIPNDVQGMAFFPDGKIVLSTSWALNPSHFYIYQKQDAPQKTEYLGLPLTFLSDDTNILSAPPMSEDLDILDGKLITFSELACDKYILGKLFFYYDIYSLKI